MLSKQRLWGILVENVHVYSQVCSMIIVVRSRSVYLVEYMKLKPIN